MMGQWCNCVECIGDQPEPTADELMADDDRNRNRNRNSDPLDAEERYCLEQLHAIRRAHEIAAKPYIDRLVRIRSLRPVPGWSAVLYGMQGVLEATAQLNQDHDGEPR